MRDDKLHAIVARSTCASEKTKANFWKLRCWKSARRCGAKHISKSKCTKHIKTHHVQTVFGSWHVEKVHAAVVRSKFPNQHVQNTSKHTMFRPVDMSKKCTQLWREAHFEVKMLKAAHVQTTFGHSDVVSRGRRKGLCTCSKVSKTWRFCSISKNDGRRGTFNRIWKDAFGVAGAVQETCSSEMLGVWVLISWDGLHFVASDLRFWEDDFAWHVQHFVRPGINFSWQAQYFRQVDWKNRKTHWYEAVSSALNFPFLKEVSQNCFVFDVVNFKNWGSLPD